MVFFAALLLLQYLFKREMLLFFPWFPFSDIGQCDENLRKQTLHAGYSHFLHLFFKESIEAMEGETLEEGVEKKIERREAFLNGRISQRFLHEKNL